MSNLLANAYKLKGSDRQCMVVELIMDDFERRLCAQTQYLYYINDYMSQMNPTKFLHITTFLVQLPHIAGHSL